MTVIALGQRFAGDDAVGLLVGDRLRGAPGIDVVEARDAIDLVEALGAGGEVIVVDAVRAPGEPGSVRVLAPEDLGQEVLPALSSHGLDVADAVALARSLHADTRPSRIRIVGVIAARTERFQEGLSPALAGSVDRAVAIVRAMSSGS